MLQAKNAGCKHLQVSQWYFLFPSKRVGYVPARGRMSNKRSNQSSTTAAQSAGRARRQGRTSTNSAFLSDLPHGPRRASSCMAVSAGLPRSWRLHVKCAKKDGRRKDRLSLTRMDSSKAWEGGATILVELNFRFKWRFARAFVPDSGEVRFQQ